MPYVTFRTRFLLTTTSLDLLEIQCAVKFQVMVKLVVCVAPGLDSVVSFLVLVPEMVFDPSVEMVMILPVPKIRSGR
jgi:hypothetical protein